MIALDCKTSYFEAKHVLPSKETKITVQKNIFAKP
jgi:hypothetical protein